MLGSMRILAATLLFCCFGLLVSGWAGAARKPQAKFWTANRCEQVFRTHTFGVRTAEGHHFWVGRVVCVGAGGANACEWTSGHLARVYSEFTVFTQARSIGSPIVRSFTMATRSEGGFIKIGRHDASHRYAGFPAYFYVSPASVRLLASNATPARFKAIVAPLAARLTQQRNATGCTGGS